MFIAFSLAFISANEFSNFDWFFFIASSSLLVIYISLDNLLNSFIVFITSFLDLGSGRLERSDLLLVFFFFQRISPVLLTGHGSSTSSFFLYFLDFMNLGEIVIYCGLEVLFLCEIIPVKPV